MSPTVVHSDDQAKTCSLRPEENNKTFSSPSMKTSTEVEKKPIKPCCACPETKKARDECMIRFGEELCHQLIEAHKECMKSYGFII